MFLARSRAPLPGWLAAFILSALLMGCATLERTQPSADAWFAASAIDPRIWVEAGAESYAEQVHALLDAAVARVERLHGLAFRSPPRVYVCASQSCFTHWVKTPGLIAAVVADNRLVLSPRLFGPEAHRLAGILTHELSHLHLGQRLGHYTPWLPVWFHEGLATLAAEGTGAESVSEAAVCEAWKRGRRVDFGRRDAPGNRHRATAFGLSTAEFYRQSWRALDWLQAYNPAAFRRWLLSVQEGQDFHIAFADAYNMDLANLLPSLFDVACERFDTPE